MRTTSQRSLESGMKSITPNASRFGVEFGFQNQAVAPVSAPRAQQGLAGSEQPTAVLRAAQKSGKACP